MNISLRKVAIELENIKWFIEKNMNIAHVEEYKHLLKKVYPKIKVAYKNIQEVNKMVLDFYQKGSFNINKTYPYWKVTTNIDEKEVSYEKNKRKKSKRRKEK